VRLVSSVWLFSKEDMDLPSLVLVPMAIPCSLRRIALARDPVQHFLLSKPEVRLDTNIWDEPTLDIAIDRFHVDPEKGLEFLGSEDFGEFRAVCS
jgi:hypothetical protein